MLRDLCDRCRAIAVLADPRIQAATDRLIKECTEATIELL
jgi:hypothetical protein